MHLQRGRSPNQDLRVAGSRARILPALQHWRPRSGPFVILRCLGCWPIYTTALWTWRILSARILVAQHIEIYYHFLCAIEFTTYPLVQNHENRKSRKNIGQLIVPFSVIITMDSFSTCWEPFDNVTIGITKWSDLISSENQTSGRLTQPLLWDPGNTGLWNVLVRKNHPLYLNKPRGRSRSSVPKEAVSRFQQRKNEKQDEPNGISISSAIPSIPMNVNATTVTMGTVAHPKSFTRVSGRAKRYRVTHCFKWIPSIFVSIQVGQRV